MGGNLPQNRSRIQSTNALHCDSPAARSVFSHKNFAATATTR